ncbi:MAG: DUF3108 domain-containing protein [Blastocatellia bacterium]
MKKSRWRILTLVALVALLINVQAQPERLASLDAPKIAQPLPFKAGEKLRYEVTFSKLIFGGAVGDVQLSVANAEHAAKDSRLALKAELTSKGFFPKLFGIKVRDSFSSIVSAQDFGLHESHKSIEEGSNRREQKSLIDRDAGRVTFTERNLADKNAEPKIKEASSPAWIQDMLSATYFVRTQPLNPGDVIKIPISDIGEVYEIEVIVEGREEVKSSAGKFKAIRLNAKIFDGRFLRRSGEMLLWISDDARRLPVRARIKTSGATVNVDLKSAR